MSHYLQRQGLMHGVMEDKATEAIAKVLEKTLYGGPAGSAQAKDRASFYGLTLSKTLENFTASPQGKKTMGQLSWAVALPAFAVGVGLGWLIFRKKTGS